MEKEKYVIIVAGGSGVRMLANIPKQFLLLAGKPILAHAIEAFNKAFPYISIIVALPAGQFSAWSDLCSKHTFKVPHQLVEGGETRFHTVRNALNLIKGDGLVAIHDGVRPLVPESLIRVTFLTAGQLGNCIPVTPLNESLRILLDDGSRAVDRDAYRAVQTPQVFQAAVVKKAYLQDYRETFTDDATVVENSGEAIHLVDGDPLNIKITHPADLALAEALLMQTPPSFPAVR